MTVQIHYWSPDVERLLGHYVEVLGFDLIHRQPEVSPADFCILKLGEAQIMIGSDPAALATLARQDQGVLEAVASRVGSPGPISVYVAVDDIDAYHEELVARGADIVERIWDAPWGNRQFSVRDPDGNLTTFFAAGRSV